MEQKREFRRDVYTCYLLTYTNLAITNTWGKDGLKKNQKQNRINWIQGEEKIINLDFYLTPY